MSLTDLDGNVLVQSSAGANGFKGSRKSTPFAAQMASAQVGQKAVANFDMKRISVVIRGPGPGSESAVRALRSCGFEKITRLTDATGVPHNGCRPRKKRRV